MKTTFLKDSNGNDSSNRLMFILGGIWCFVITSALLWTGKASVPESIAFFSAVFGVLVAMKLGQKPMEK